MRADDGVRDRRPDPGADPPAPTASEEQRFRALFDASPVGIALSDEHGLFVLANDAMGALFGCPPDELVGRSGAEFVHPDDLALHATVEQAQARSQDSVARVEARHIHPDGTMLWLELTITAYGGPAGRRWTIFCAQDVTRRKAAETALQRSRAELTAIASVSRSAQLGQDPRPAVLAACRSLSGADSVVIVELAEDGLAVTGSVGAQTAAHRRPTWSSTTGQVYRSARRVWWTGDADSPPLHTSDPVDAGSTRSVLWEPVVSWDRVIAVVVASWQQWIPDALHEAVRAVMLIASEAAGSLQAAQLWSELQASAYTDPMTGALNRRAWDIALTRLIGDACRTSRPLVVALVDLDHFKAYNDEFGHDAGDALLRTFTRAAIDCLREADVFARWGGEEFIIALPDCSPESALDVLARVRAAVPEGRTCSIGMTTWRPAEPTRACVTRADAALYDAKHGGRDRVASR